MKTEKAEKAELPCQRAKNLGSLWRFPTRSERSAYEAERLNRMAEEERVWNALSGAQKIALRYQECSTIVPLTGGNVAVELFMDDEWEWYTLSLSGKTGALTPNQIRIVETELGRPIA